MCSVKQQILQEFIDAEVLTNVRKSMKVGGHDIKSERLNTWKSRASKRLTLKISVNVQ